MAAGIRSGMGFASLVLIAGSLVLLFFVVLSGLKDTTPLNKIFFLQADLSKIASARAQTQWTFFYVCGEGNTNCGSPVPALPIGYAWVGGSAGAPTSLVGSHAKNTTSRYYYWMWKFGWIFYLIALASDVFAFFAALLSPISRLASGFAGLVLGFALFWMTLAAALMTTTFVKARDELRDAGMSAEIGKYAFGFTWGAWFAMLLAMLMLFLGVLRGGNNHTTRSSSRKGGVFRNESTRRSFVDNDSQRRVKDEYA